MLRRAILIGTLAAVTSMTAAAASQDRGKPRRECGDAAEAYEAREAARSGGEHRYRARRQSTDSEADIMRAESCDPAGRFDGYPAWARAAFTCGSQR